MFQSSFSLFYCYYLLICHQSALGRAVFQHFRSILGLTAHKNCFTLRWPSIIMLNGNCAVVSCRSDNNRWKQREKKDCSKHKGLSRGSYLCSRRFTLQYPSPSKLLNSERREVWIQEIGGIYAKNTAWTPCKIDLVCLGLGQGGLRGYKPPLEGEQLFFQRFLPFLIRGLYILVKCNQHLHFTKIYSPLVRRVSPQSESSRCHGWVQSIFFMDTQPLKTQIQL